jgi:phenylpropionate dioxygenase-like ring-hydroxylating dioxygenase large terminal subunit
MSIDEMGGTEAIDEELPEPSPSTDRRAAYAPKLGLRDRIPKLGLTEYWYPAIPDRSVPSKRPVRRQILGEDVVLFRDAHQRVVALTNWCPHRNASLAKGDCIYPGTITCPYHGATFDASGKAVAFLGEGAGSLWCGQRGSSAKSYPTRTLKGLVFIWTGEGEPAPIEEDVPPEFFDEAALVQFSVQRWRANWRASLENLQDAHVFYVHRNSIELLSQDVQGLTFLLHLGPKRPPTRVVNERALVFENPRFFDFIDSDQTRKTNFKRDFQDSYPGLGGAKYPKSLNRLRLARCMGFMRRHFRRKLDWLVDDVEWAQGVHLPTTFRLDQQSHVYSRTVTPMDENRSWVFYYNTTYPKNAYWRVRNQVIFWLYYNWKQHRNFSGQDKHVVEGLRYENPTEKFSSSDAFPLAWRRMVINNARHPPSAASRTLAE